jgi:CelD/BcsL family acetyltransferase involved in cellulose biosynthesis
VPNPLAALPRQQSPNCGYAISLDQDFDTLYRNRFSGRSRNSLRRKERKLQDLGAVEYGWAGTNAERGRMLEEFFSQKAAWFQKHGISDPFADPHYRGFFHSIAALPEGTPGRLELGFLKAGTKVVATFHGAEVAGRFHMLLSSIAPGESERWSPGILLMRNQIESLCARGAHYYDLGSGHAQHKSEWSDVEIPLFDSFLALDEMGYAVTIPLSVMSGTKRKIKNSKALWSMAQFVRRNLVRLTPGAA